MKFVLFTDNLADLSIGEVCRAAKQAGFDGLDLTLRPGGHVKPEEAELGLAAARQAADAAEVVILMASTAVTGLDSPHADEVFAAAAHYGVRHLKLGYWRYEPFGTLARQIDEAQRSLSGLVRLGRQYHVLPCIHVHSGPILSNSGPATYLILRDFKPDEAGAYVDPMHMTVEGGMSGWEMGLDLLAPWVALAGIKNSRWIEDGRDDKGQLKFKTQYTPLADGHAPLPAFMGRLREIGFDGTVSLHSEYKGGSSFRVLTTPELLAQSAADLTYLKTLL